LKSLVGEFGRAVASLYVLHRVLEKLSGGRARIVAYALYAQPIGREQFAKVRDDAGTVVEPALPHSPLLAQFPRPPAVIGQRFASGAACYAATVKGQFAGHVWISRERHDEDEVRCEYVLAAAERSAWDFDVYVEPRFRLGRTMGRLWKAVDAALSAQGVQWSFSRISLFNRASIGAHERLGAMRVGHALFLVVGPLQCAWLPAAPFVHLSISDRRRPSIMLQPPDAAG
jgi:hypothetical protein